MLAKVSQTSMSKAVIVAMTLMAPLMTAANSAASETLLAMVKPSLRQDSACENLPSLPRRLATLSKYDQSIRSKSVLNEAARQDRALQLAPIQAAIRQVSALARTDGGNAAMCALQGLRSWAASKALTDMATSDANLSRDSLTSDIAAIVLTIQARGISLNGEDEIRSWLHTLASQTMVYYDVKAGPVSRRNNHRYWAATAIADLGAILGDEKMRAWARTSFSLGACQIDDEGFLPLELARADRAHEYHLHAYGALNRLARQVAGHAHNDVECSDRLGLLYALVADGAGSRAAFEKRTGLAQRHPSRRQLAAAFMPPPTPGDLGTTSALDPI